MSLKSKFKRTLSGLLSMAMVATIVPCFPVSAEDSEKYPYTMFASSNEDGAITVNAYNFTINGQIATNGTVNCNGNTNINYESSNNICVDMVYIPNKIDSDFFNGRKVDNVENDYTIEEPNIDISEPLAVNGTTTMQGNVTIQAGVKSKDDIYISGDVKNSYNTVIYSQYGDINIDCNNVSLNGLIYAPFGTIHITATNLNMNDTMIIANKIIIDAPNVNVNYSEHFGSYFKEVSDTMKIPDEDFGYLKDLNDNDIPDFFENSINWKYIEDTDGDGVPDIIEINTGTDPNVPDGDINDIVDGITLEMLYNNPLVILDSETGKPVIYGDMNTDKVLDAFDLVLMRKMYLENGYVDYADLDDDGDLDADDLKWLEDYLLSRVNSFPVYNNFDSDGDGLTDYVEVEIYGINPHKADTDGDGLSDYFEIVWMETNPLKADGIAYEDPDEDGLINMLVVQKVSLINNGI
ncbi:MAG: thrombospondin type 3 repeat-containing protein [Ruminococcus sp.]|nr:thrombospondin type 3 repeat-containing protein [Ruminococcus sp.]